MLDGGALIQHIPWMRSRGNIPRDRLSVRKVCLKRYGEAVVVFDGYSDKSTETQRIEDKQKGMLE